MAKVRINKVLKTYNIGISDLADYLNSVGYPLKDTVPNAKLSDIQYGFVQIRFYSNLVPDNSDLQTMDSEQSNRPEKKSKKERKAEKRLRGKAVKVKAKDIALSFKSWRLSSYVRDIISNSNKNKISELSVEQIRKKHDAATKQREKEANRRRAVNDKWMSKEHSAKYIRASITDSLSRNNKKISEEFFDDDMILLNTKHQCISTSGKKRILRRIIDKYNAKSIHKKLGRMDSLLRKYVMRNSLRKSMENIQVKTK